MNYCKYYEVCEIANNSCEEGLPCGLYNRREEKILRIKQDKEEQLRQINEGDVGLIKLIRRLKW